MKNNTDAIPTHSDLTETARIANIPMRSLVFGPSVPRRRAIASRPFAVRRFKLRLVGHLEVRRLRGLALAVALLVGGCATVRGPVAPVVVESVGELTASATHVTQAAVHGDTDLSVAFMPSGGDDDAPVSVTAGAEVVEAPEVASKSGLTMGGPR